MSRKKAHAESHPDERWVISYADLVTLLFGFFLLLYATADQNVVKMEELSKSLAAAFNVPLKEGSVGAGILTGGSGVVPGRTDSQSRIESDLQFIRASVHDQSRRAGLTGQILVTRQDDRIVIRLADQLIFPSASADLRPDALPLLDIVARAIRELPNEIRVEGHTDNVPVGTERYPTNWELSSARATAVLRYLVERQNLKPGQLFAAGFGQERTVATNLTPEGRALNRRADIVILYPSARIPADGPLGGSLGR